MNPSALSPRARAVALLAAPVAWLLAACAAGPAERPLRADPTPLTGFPSQALEDIVYAQARFEDSRHVFGVDLLGEHGIVPVHLSLELRGEGQDEAQILLSPERMDLRLYLADGTPAAPIGADEIARRVDEDVARAVRDQRFRGGLLAPRPTEGFVFFELTPADEFRESGGTTVRRAEAVYARSLDVLDSLVAFNVTVRGDERPLYVGIER